MLAGSCGWRREVGVRGGLDARLAVGLQVFLVVAAPATGLHQVGAEPGDRVERPVLAHLPVVAVATGVVGGGVIGEAVGERLDQRRAPTASGPLDRLFHDGPDGDHVVAVDLFGGDPGGDALLGQGLGGRLVRPRHRDRPLVVVDHEDQW